VGFNPGLEKGFVASVSIYDAAPVVPFFELTRSVGFNPILFFFNRIERLRL
jgi:hypothetical protein